MEEIDQEISKRRYTIFELEEIEEDNIISDERLGSFEGREGSEFIFEGDLR